MTEKEYYLDQIRILNENINSYIKEKNKYAEVLVAIKQLQSILKNIKTSLMKIEQKFKDGAFISNNETFDKGILKTDYDTLAEDILSIDQIVITVENKITLLENSIISCKEKCNLYQSNISAIL